MSAEHARERIAKFDWQALDKSLDEQSHARLPGLLDASECRSLRCCYDDPGVGFRRTVQMSRHHFGRGEYRYFDYPLPKLVAALRDALYPHLAAIANRWRDRLGEDARWPERLSELIERCHAEGQRRPTPLLLRYGVGDYNCLHQDVYGEVVFPLQVIVLLSEPGSEFEGGELVLTEQRARRQSRPLVVALRQGDGVIVPVRRRPEAGLRGYRRVNVRHGVSGVLSGARSTLGLIFHDAA